MESKSEKIAFKSALKQACINILLERISNVTHAMKQAQESANNQEKSSVGDKHETSRAISQADRDMNARQLMKASMDLNKLEAINVQQIYDAVVVGSVFTIDNKIFFVAGGLGTLNINNKIVMVISHLSPLFISLKMKQAGDEIIFQDEEKLIGKVY